MAERFIHSQLKAEFSQDSRELIIIAVPEAGKNEGKAHKYGRRRKNPHRSQLRLVLPPSQDTDTAAPVEPVSIHASSVTKVAGGEKPKFFTLKPGITLFREMR